VLLPVDEHGLETGFQHRVLLTATATLS
jgi:hypothetical protein